MKCLGKKRKIPKTIKKQKPKSETSFLKKLYTILNDKNNINIIKWCEDGHSFIISNFSHFVENILPLYFRHQNYSSFVRQLNLYNFRKEKTLQKGEIKYTNIFKNIKLIKKKVKKNTKPKDDNDKLNNSYSSYNSLGSKLIVNISNNITKDKTNKENKSFEDSKISDLKNNSTNDKLLSFLLDKYEKNNEEQKK